MDDIKICASTQNDLIRPLRVIEKCSNNIKMNFGIDKYRLITIRRGIRQKGKWYTMFQRSDEGVIPSMEKSKIYRYLGAIQTRRCDQSTIKKELQE